MSGHPSEELLALSFSRDLKAAQSAEVFGHLDSCRECRETFEQLQTMRSMLMEAVPEPLDEDVRSVRHAVQQQIAGRRIGPGTGWFWKAVTLAAACIIAALFLLHLRPEHRPTPTLIALPPLTLPVIAPREIAFTSLLSEHHSRRTRPERLTAGIRSVSWKVQQDGSSQLLIATEDPNVVILLPMGNAGDKHAN